MTFSPRRAALAVGTAIPLALALAIGLPLAAHADATYIEAVGTDSAGLPTLTYTFSGNPDAEFVALNWATEDQRFLEFDVPYTFSCIAGGWIETTTETPATSVELLTIDPATFDAIVTDTIEFDDALCVAAPPVIPAEAPAPTLPSMGAESSLLAPVAALAAVALGALALALSRRKLARR